MTASLCGGWRCRTGEVLWRVAWRHIELSANLAQAVSRRRGRPMDRSIPTRCCIAGGGPAGIMLGYLLARAGVDVVVLEKHADFFRDFRGDTIHPSTLQVMDELGLLDDLLKIPHSEVRELSGRIGDDWVRVADLSRLRVKHPFIAMMPQWDFLNF